MNWTGKYFTLEEMTASPTARRLGIDNTPTPDAVIALHNLVKEVLDPLREAWGAPIVVTSGYRCPKLNSCVGGVRMSQHCFDDKTEVLTESGWKKYTEISKDDNVYSYNVGKDSIELTPIDSIIIREHSGKMMHIKSTCIDLMVTDKHRMLVRYARHKYKRKGVNNITPEGQAYFDSLKTDNDKYHFELAEDVFGKRRIYKCASVYDGEDSTDLDLLKFCMAFVCDGFWSRKDKSIAMGFRFKKERKITYLQKLANALGWTYAMHVDKYGISNFYFKSKYAKIVFDIVGKGKILPNYLVGLSVYDKKSLLECYTEFDGHVDERDDNQRTSICTVIKRNADVLQAMAVTSGIKCSVRMKDAHEYEIRGKKGIGQPSYILATCQKDETQANEERYEWVDYDGIVWCVNNRNTTLITRRNGDVSIQGNCLGQAADIRTLSDRPSDNRKLRDLLIEIALPFDQLIDEFGCDWLHVSYREGRNRKERITAYRKNKKTLYEPGFKK